MQAGPDDVGSEIEVPLGLGLELELPASGTGWRPASGTVHVRVDDVEEHDDGGATVRMTAVGLGTDALELQSDDGATFPLTVTVVEPLFND